MYYRQLLTAVIPFSILFATISALPAEAFTISPMMLVLEPVGGVQAVRIKNPSDKPIDMSLKVFAWTDSHDTSALEPTTDLLAMPPVFEIPPQGEQVVRIALRNPLQPETEQSYRALIGEVPSEIGPEDGIGFNLTISLPIFVRPDGVSATPVWSIRTDEHDRSTLVLANEGSAHLKLGTVQLSPETAKDEKLFEGQGGYVLNGDRRDWPLNIDLAGLKGPFVVKADSNIGPIETQISLPDS